MAKTTIEWTQHSFNPVGGCFKVSPGCKNCYAVRVARRLGGNPNNDIHAHYGPLTVIQGGQMNWSGEVTLNERVLMEPLKRKQPTTYFISLSDLFYDKRPDEHIDRVFAVIGLCDGGTTMTVEGEKKQRPFHTMQVLTKYAERMLAYYESRSPLWARKHFVHLPGQSVAGDWVRRGMERVHLGVSVENQQYADERIPLLLRTPAAVRFVSYEPAIGPVDFARYLPRVVEDSYHGGPIPMGGVDQIIFGFESGPGARPAEIEWARSTKNQCVEAGVAFFLKQYADAKGKKISLPELDGQQWMQLPRVVNHGV